MEKILQAMHAEQFERAHSSRSGGTCQPVKIARQLRRMQALERAGEPVREIQLYCRCGGFHTSLLTGNWQDKTELRLDPRCPNGYVRPTPAKPGTNLLFILKYLKKHGPCRLNHVRWALCKFRGFKNPVRNRGRYMEYFRDPCGGFYGTPKPNTCHRYWTRTRGPNREVWITITSEGLARLRKG